MKTDNLQVGERVKVHNVPGALARDMKEARKLFNTWHKIISIDYNGYTGETVEGSGILRLQGFQWQCHIDNVYAIHAQRKAVKKPKVEKPKTTNKSEWGYLYEATDGSEKTVWLGRKALRTISAYDHKTGVKSKITWKGREAVFKRQQLFWDD